MSEKQFSEKPWGSVGVRKYGPKIPKLYFRETGGPKIWSEKPFSKKPGGCSYNLPEKQFSEKPRMVRNLGPKSCFRRGQAGPKLCFQRCPKSNFRRNRRSENLVRKAVFEEARVVRKPVRKAIFGEAEDGPKPWSEEPFSERPSWSETVSKGVRKAIFGETGGPKSRFRRSQGGPKSNFRRSRGWSQSYPEMCTETNFQRSREGLKSYSIFGEDRVV